jgi:hypothetical protein
MQQQRIDMNHASRITAAASSAPQKTNVNLLKGGRDGRDKKELKHTQRIRISSANVH